MHDVLQNMLEDKTSDTFSMVVCSQTLLCPPQIGNPSKYRVDLRFFAELVSVGVFKDKEGLQLLANQLALLINNDKEEHNNLSILISFCKHCGDDYAGLLPRKYR